MPRKTKERIDRGTWEKSEAEKEHFGPNPTGELSMPLWLRKYLPYRDYSPFQGLGPPCRGIGPLLENLGFQAIIKAQGHFDSLR